MNRESNNSFQIVENMATSVLFQELKMEQLFVMLLRSYQSETTASSEEVSWPKQVWKLQWNKLFYYRTCFTEVMAVKPLNINTAQTSSLVVSANNALGIEKCERLKDNWLKVIRSWKASQLHDQFTVGSPLLTGSEDFCRSFILLFHMLALLEFHSSWI